MKPSDFQRTVQCQFEAKLKAVTKGIVRNYKRELRRRQNKEVSFSELPDIVIENLASYVPYESEAAVFEVCGTQIRVMDSELAEALMVLPERERRILLMYYFIGLSNTEIGKLLELNRTTSYRSRMSSLEKIRKKLQELPV